MRSGTLPGRLAVFRTSNIEVPNAARSTGSVQDLTGAIPDLTGAIPDLTGSIRDLKLVKNARSRTLPVDLAVFRTSNLEVPNAARSTGSVQDLPGAIPDLPDSIRDLKFLKNARYRTLPVDLAVFRTSKVEVRNTARSTGSVRDLKC